jgi:hypothetical protein
MADEPEKLAPANSDALADGLAFALNFSGHVRRAGQPHSTPEDGLLVKVESARPRPRRLLFSRRADRSASRKWEASPISARFSMRG